MKFFLTTLFLVCCLIFSSCKRKEISFDGPDLNDLHGPFNIIKSLTASRDSVDFAANQTVYFSAELSKMVEWQLTITGLKTGAKKIITGRSKSINATNALWNGSTTTFPMFTPEKCAVMLTFHSEADTLRDTVMALSSKKNSGYVVTDFESGSNAKWTIFHQSGASMEYQIGNTGSLAQGNNYFSMAGAVTWDWAIASIEIPATANSIPHFPLNSNPNNVYLNVLIWGEPGITNAFLLMGLREDDDGNGTFNSATEDEYEYKIQNINWVGWKLVSLKYSTIGDPATVKGNKQHNPDKLSSIRFFLLADPSSGFSKTKIDYIVFTDNKALEP